MDCIAPIVHGITESVYASGRVKSFNQHEVFSMVNGIIQQVHVREGDFVKKGDPLVTLQSETSRLDFESAKISSAFSSVSSNLDKLHELNLNIMFTKEKMQADSLLFQRQQNLWENDIGSRNELEQRELTWKNSVTAYQSALLEYQQLKKQIDYSAQQSENRLQVSKAVADEYIIRARQNGRIYSLLKEEGELVNLQTPMAIVGDASQFILDLQVDEYDIGKIRTGQQIVFSLDSYKGQAFEAIVREVEPIMNNQSRSFRVEGSFITKPDHLYPNLNVEANIVTNSKPNALTIPRSCLLDEQYVVLKNGEKRKVQVGLKDYERVEILHGLTENDIIQKINH
jgi:RND family efflux transporter MFP subunit